MNNIVNEFNYPALPLLQRRLLQFIQYSVIRWNPRGIAHIAQFFYPAYRSLGMREINYQNRFHYIGDLSTTYGYLTACGIVYYSIDRVMHHVIYHLKNDQTEPLYFFDIGSNIGLVSLLCCSINANIQVHCFEPNPYVSKLLSRNLEMNKFLAHVNQLALGYIRETANLNLGFQSGNSTIISNALNQELNGNSVAIDIDTLDRYCNDLNIRPDLIKIDVEGFEPKVIQGAINMLEKHHPFLIVEINPKTLHFAGSSEGELLHMLTSLGYDLYYINPRQILMENQSNYPRKTWHNCVEVIPKDSQGNNLYDVLAIPMGIHSR